MRTKTNLFLVFLSALLFCSCSEDLKNTKNLYDDWWPVHASGSAQNDRFTATWDGDLSRSGCITVTFVDRESPDLSYTRDLYYPAYSFKKRSKSFSTVDISSRDYVSSRPRKFYLEDGRIFFETTDGNGIGTGSYDEGHAFRFLNDDTFLLEGVTYERYSVWSARNKIQSDKLRNNGDRIPVSIYL